MTLSKPTSFLFIFFATLVIFPCGINETVCPKLVIIEKGGAGTVSCNTTRKTIAQVYWYMGDPALRSPILRLENGQPGGTEYAKGHYSISIDGAMTITNATIKHEAEYTTLIYFEDETRETISIMVNITISPWLPCTVIDVCTTCGECSMAVNETGKLTCSINGVRPVILLKWNIKIQSRIRIVEHPPVIAYDETSGTWNSSVEISYDVSSCNQEAILQCEAEDYLILLKLSKSSVRIYTANCTDGSSDFTPEESNNSIIMVAVLGSCIGVISVILLLVCIFRARRGNAALDPKDMELTSSSAGPSSVPKAIDGDALKLVLSLKEKYKVSNLLNSLPMGEKIVAAYRFPVSHCEILHSDGVISDINTDRLLESNGIRNEDRVILTGGPDYWKTIFTKKLVQKWIVNNENDYVLLYVTKKAINANMTLIDILEQETSIDRGIITKGLRNKKCILLLDGLADIVFEKSASEEKVESKYDNNNSMFNSSKLASVTFSDLLTKKAEDINIQIWVITWNNDKTDKIFQPPFAKVYLSNVDRQQFNTFIENICNEYKISMELQSGDVTLDSAPDDTKRTSLENISGDINKKCVRTVESDHVEEIEDLNLPDKEPDIASEETKMLLCDEKETGENDQREVDYENCQQVKGFLKENQIYKEFNGTPILLSIIVRIIIRKFSQKHSACDDVKMTTTEELVCDIVRLLQENYVQNKEDKASLKTCHIEKHLEELALYLIGTDTLCVDKQDPIVRDCVDAMNIATEMGFILYLEVESDDQPPGKNTQLSSMRFVKFSHPLFTYYFAATNMLKLESPYTEALGRFNKSQVCPVLKFLIHLEKSSRKDLFGALRKYQMDLEMIMWLHKWENQEVEEIRNILSGTVIQISGLEVMKHQTLFSLFCKKCSDMQIKLESLSIMDVISVSFLTSLELPAMKMLTLVRQDLGEMDFVSILKWLSQKQIIVRFYKCNIPELDNNAKEEVQALEGIRVEVIRQRVDKPTLSLNFKTATWKKKEITLFKAITGNLPSPSKISEVVSTLK